VAFFSSTSLSQDTIPAGDAWLHHMEHDLLRFWTTADALGEDTLGKFPLRMYHDGAGLPRHLREHPEDRSFDGMKSSLGWVFPVLYSRQSYLYCVGYHLTGDPKLLVYAKTGIDRYLKYCREQNGAFRFWIVNEDNPQAHSPNYDCVVNSYCLLAPAMYYYLTRDPRMLWVLRQGREFIFRTFTGNNPDWKTLAATDDNMGQTGLGIMLDVVNAFMFLATPALVQPERTQWQNDLKRLIDGIAGDLYDPKHHTFYNDMPRWSKPQTAPDYYSGGMDPKAFWYCYLFGNRYGDSSLVRFGLENGRIAEERFHIPETGMWAANAFPDGSRDRISSYWCYNEMDQLLSTLAIADPSYAKRLPLAYRRYFERFVDTLYGGVYHIVNDPGQPADRQLKGDHWKRDYHTSEHALVGYITSYAIRKQPVALYYAFRDSVPDTSTITPCHYNGRISAVEDLGKMKETGLVKYRLTFEDVR